MANDFPKTYKCEKCGSSDTVIHRALAPLKASGQVSLDHFGSLEVKITPLMDPATCQVTVPCAVTHWDVCYDCGHYYCTKTETKNVPVEKFNNPLMMRFK
jgi:hypothetical protein